MLPYALYFNTESSTTLLKMANSSKHSFLLKFKAILIVLFFYGIATTTSIWANNIDSLKTTLANDVAGKDITGILDLAAKNAAEDLPLAIAYSAIALEKAKKLKNFKEIYRIHRETGFFYEDNNQLSDALMAYHNALEAAIKVDDYKLKLSIYTDLAITHRKLGNYKRTKDYHQKALELAQSTDDLKMTEYSYHGLGFLYETIGDYDKAIEYYLKSAGVCRSKRFDKRSNHHLSKHRSDVHQTKQQ